MLSIPDVAHWHDIWLTALGKKQSYDYQFIEPKLMCREVVSSVTSSIAVFMCSILVLASVGRSDAQQVEKIPRIVLLSPGTPTTAAPNNEAFREGIRELGYLEGNNIVIDYRYAEGKPSRYDQLVNEVVHLNVDVIVTASGPITETIKNATSTIPIVMAAVADPVGSGLVSSLAHPGGNVTGLSMRSPDLSGKRLQLLKEVIPKIRRVAFFWNPANEGNRAAWKTSATLGPQIGLEVRSLPVQQPSDFDIAFKVFTKERLDAFTVARDPFLNQNVKLILKLALKTRSPAIYDAREFVLSGGLMSYSPNHPDLYRRAATYVDKILKGSKPADLPVEQPMKPEFLINLRAAKEIGVTIPPEVIQRADKVIR